MIPFLTAHWDVFMTQLSIYWQAHPFLLNDDAFLQSKSHPKEQKRSLKVGLVLEKQRRRSQRDARRPSNIPPGETPSEALVWR